MTMQQFSGIIEKKGSKTWVALPFDPNGVWGARERHHITGSVNGTPVRGPLGMDGAAFVLPLGAAWMRDSGLQAGASVEVILSPEGPQADQLPADIAAALANEPQASAFFESLATFYRKGYLRWIEGARQPEIRAARIAEMVKLLKAGKKQK